MELFRIEAFVADKNVGSVLRALAGLAVRPPSVLPVTNVTLKDGKLAAESTGNVSETLLAQFIAAMHAAKRGVVTVEDVRTFLRSKGKPMTSAGYILQTGQKAKLLRKVPGKGGRGTRYTVAPKARG